MPYLYDEAFSRNIGLVTEAEQQQLRHKKVAIAGMGGVGGNHLLTLARLGIAQFHIADFDRFDLPNFNRQVGANINTIGQPKLDVLAVMVKNINPEITLTTFPNGVTENGIDAFLSGVDMFVDGLDFFVLDIRRKIFQRCYELGIPAVTAAPIGMGTAYLTFLPGQMSFERYFRLDGLPPEKQYVNFLLGLTPHTPSRRYIVDQSRVRLAEKRGPSTIMACNLCAGVAGIEVLKILLRRGKVYAAPYYQGFDGYLNQFTRGRLYGGSANPWHRIKLFFGYRLFAKLLQTSSARG